MTNREGFWVATARAIVEEKTIAERRKMFKRAQTIQPVNSPTKEDQLLAKMAAIGSAAKDLLLCGEMPPDVKMAVGRLLEALDAAPDRCWIAAQGGEK